MIPQADATLISDSHRTKTIFIKEGMRGLQFSLTTFWFWLFYLTLIRDLLAYDKNESFGVNEIDILLGRAIYQPAFSTHWGSDIPSQWNFITGYVLFLTLPLLMALGWALFHLKWRTPLSSEEYQDLQAKLNHPGYIFLRPQFLRSVQQLEWELLWNRDLPDHGLGNSLTRENIFNDLKVLKDSQSIFARLRNIYSLAKIIRGIDASVFEALGLKSVEQTYLLSCRAKALKKLNKIKNAPGFINSYANIVLWQAGESNNCIVHSVLGALYFFNLVLVNFAIFRYGKVIVDKSDAINQFRYEKNACKDLDKLWLYMDQIANYACSICGDWSFVYFKDMYSAQGCLDGLLYSNEDILNYDLSRLSKFSDVTTVDLSKKRMAEWQPDYLRGVLNKLSSFNNVKNFNMSNVEDNIIWNEDSINILSNFFSKTKFSNIDISGQYLSANQSIALLQGFRLNKALSHINLAKNDLADIGAVQAINTLSRLNVVTIDLSFNDITSEGVTQFSSNLASSSFVNILLQGVAFDQSNFNVLATNLTKSIIKQVDLSYNDLSSIDMTMLGEAIPTSQMEMLKLDQCKLTYNAIFSLAPAFSSTSRMQYFSIGKNYLTNRGGISLIAEAQNSTVSTVNINNNQLSDAFVDSVFNILPKLKIKSLDLSGNPISNSKLDKLILNLPTSLENLNLANTHW